MTVHPVINCSLGLLVYWNVMDLPHIGAWSCNKEGISLPMNQLKLTPIITHRLRRTWMKWSWSLAERFSFQGTSLPWHAKDRKATSGHKFRIAHSCHRAHTFCTLAVEVCFHRWLWDAKFQDVEIGFLSSPKELHTGPARMSQRQQGAFQQEIERASSF